MRALKFLCARSFRLRYLIVPLILYIGIAVPVVLAHEPPGSEDYLICKMAPLLCVFLIQIVYMMFLSIDLNGNRLMRSSPISKELRTRAVPLFSFLTNLVLIVVTVLLYGAFIMISGQVLSHLSDMLLLAAFSIVVFVVFCTLGLHFTWGMIFMLYAWMPVAGIMFFISGEQWHSGFGLELWLSAVIFAAAVIVSFILAFVISHLFYKYSDFKAMTQNATTV